MPGLDPGIHEPKGGREAAFVLSNEPPDDFGSQYAAVERDANEKPGRITPSLA
jgi:hypothetical protein